jgi:hypothetical protein
MRVNVVRGWNEYINCVWNPKLTLPIVCIASITFIPITSKGEAHVAD